MKPTIDLLIFDLDGTLVDSKPDIADSVNLSMEEFGLPVLPMEVIEEYIGTGVQPLIRKIFERHAPHHTDGALGAFAKYYFHRLTCKTTVFPGTREVLVHYAAKHKVVLTNKMQRFADPIVDRLRLRSHFKAVFGREAFSQMKPHPAPVLEICAQLRIAPQRAAIVGDTEVDIAAGKGAGAWTVAALFGYGKAQGITAMKPDFSIHEPRDLMALFE